MNAGIWSSGSQPAALRAEAARAMLSEVHLPWSLRIADREPYDCRLAWQGLGGCTVIECSSSQLSGYRGGPEIRRTDGDYVGLLLVLAGQERVRQGDVAVNLGAGDMLLWDSAEPLQFEVRKPLQKVTLLIPRSRLDRAAPGIKTDGAVRLDSRSGLGALAAGHLASLGRVARDIPVGAAPLAADILIDLVGRLVDPGAEPGQPADLLSRVLKHVEQHLEDPQLTPSRIAATFGITPRYLHMLFAQTGGTLSAHIRARRIACVRRDLVDPRLAHLSVTDIALRWGFSDSAHASRVFRRSFGISPGRYRVMQK